MKYQTEIINKLTDGINDLDMLIYLFNKGGSITPQDAITKLNFIKSTMKSSQDLVKLN